MNLGSWLTIQPENISVDKQNLSKNSALCETPVTKVILAQKIKKIYSSNLASCKQFCQPGQNP